VNQALERAATHGRLDELKALFPTATQQERQSALFTSVIYDHPAVVTYLLEHGVDVNCASDSSTPIFFAVGTGLAMTRLLLAHGARADVVTSSNHDPLHIYLNRFAPGHRSPPVDLVLVQLLLDSGVDLHRPTAPSYLLPACWSGDAALVSFLIAKGCNPNVRGKGDHDLLWKAISQPTHSGAVLAALVRGGLDANAKLSGVFDETVLMEVCARGDLETAQLLLSRGADPNVRCKRGTALTRAQESGNPALVDLLLEHGARPLVPGQDPSVLARLDEAEQAARTHPRSVDVRQAWAEALLAAGFRAAAAREFEAARLLGALPSETPLVLENPAGHRWSFVPFSLSLEEVTARVSDGRFPRAFVTDGTRTVPFAVWLGPACDRCDERGQVECASCGGTGSHSSMFSDDDVACDPRATCYSCLGLKFAVVGDAFAKGECKHASTVEERAWVREGVWLLRCATCGLSGLKADHARAYNVWTRWACAVCERLKCTCAR
jgi:ankyrin repeat protein